MTVGDPLSLSLSLSLELELDWTVDWRHGTFIIAALQSKLSNSQKNSQQIQLNFETLINIKI